MVAEQGSKWKKSSNTQINENGCKTRHLMKSCEQMDKNGCKFNKVIKEIIWTCK